MLYLFKINICGFRRFLIHGNSSYVVLYTQCLRYNICSAWFLDIRISTCCSSDQSLLLFKFKIFVLNTSNDYRLYQSVMVWIIYASMEYLEWVWSIHFDME